MQNGALITLQQKLISMTNSCKQNNGKNDNSHTHTNSEKEKSSKNNSLTISYIKLQKMPVKIKEIMQQNFFKNLIDLSIISCDLRTFENFPKLLNLKNLNVSKNSLRGSFQFLVKNKAIRYIDVSNNIINDVKKFQPLRCLKNISIYAKQNPFLSKINSLGLGESKTSFREFLKNINIKLLDKPLQLKKEDKKQIKMQKAQKIPFKQQPSKNQQSIEIDIKQKKHKILQKIKRKYGGNDNQDNNNVIAPFKTETQKLSADGYFNFRQFMNEPRQNYTSIPLSSLSQISKQRQSQPQLRQRDSQRESRPRDSSTNFYQIFHNEDVLINNQSSEQPIRNFFNRKHKGEQIRKDTQNQNDEDEDDDDEDDDKLSQMDQDIPQNIQWKRTGELDLQMGFNRQEIRTIKQDDEDNDQQNQDQFDVLSVQEESNSNFQF